jgi:hypothetical protein
VLVAVAWPSRARALDVADVGGTPAQLDVTETTIAAQHFDARDYELRQDSGWGGWINRLNAALRWGKWTAGLRLDSAVYWRRPADSPTFPDLQPQEQRSVLTDGESRFRNSVYPAKLWLTYTAPGVEVTAGDAYVQFGRGLILSMRKIDELGIDTTLRGAKVQIAEDPFALTAVAGFGNPSRVDEATGRAMFVTEPIAGDRVAPVFGSDRIVGVDIQAGRGLPVTLSTHAVRVTRCAPYRYDAGGNVTTDFFSDPGTVAFGSCAPSDTATWLASIPSAPPSLDASEITMAGQSLEVPSLWGHGKLYLEAAAQQRHHDIASRNVNDDGNALYGALSVDAGEVTTTLEGKSNRNFYAAAAAVNTSAAPEFNIVTYSFLPPTETLNQLDTQLGNFNACVDAGRLRADVNVSRDLIVYGQGVYAFTKSEQTSGACDARGRTLSSLPAASVQDRVLDGLAGFEWAFDDNLSHAYVSGGARDDVKEDGGWYYRELHVEYSIAKLVAGPWSVEVQGRHRLRKEEHQNLDSTTYVEQWWHEGENYVAVKMAPKWVFSQGFEYTTLIGQPTYYLNGAVLYKFTSSSNVRLFVGQQRGAFRCASGVCRYFPPFEGARAELTLRF